MAVALQRAERWVERGQPWRAVEHLELLLTSYPDDPDLHYHLGYAYATAGATWRGMSAYEKAQALGDDPRYSLPLVSLYLEAGLNVHALRIFRQMIKQDVPPPIREAMRSMVAGLEDDLNEAARSLDRPRGRVEQGLYEMEEGQRALNDDDFQASVAVNRQAIRRLGDWPPPHNNLSLALFFDGQPEEAVEVARRVIQGHPKNVHALSNAVRFLAWSGREGESRDLWSTLKDVTPRDADARLKMAEAAAALSEDEHVYRILKPLDESAEADTLLPPFLWRVRFFLAVAEANLGRRRDARQRLEKLQDLMPFAGNYLKALEENRPGLGWSDRYPYFRVTEMLPRREIETLVELSDQEDEMAPQRFRRRMSRFVERFPQSVHVGEKLIWEEENPESGIALLRTLGTPEAWAALRRFGLSQAGDDYERLSALTPLAEAGEIEEGESLRVWLEGEWHEVELREQIYPGEEVDEAIYSPEAADLLNRGIDASRAGDSERAAELFERVLELAPRAKEAYNNLGAVYAGRGEHERARAMFRQALEIDPLYVFPRCNLVAYLLDEDDVEEAEAMLAPLAEVQELPSDEVAFYNFTRARVLVHQGEHDAAKRALKVVLRVEPDHKPAKDLLERVERMEMFSEVSERFKSYQERSRKRDLARRKRLRAELSTPDPTLAEALPLYTKDALTGMARVVMPWGGWSALRKAELIDEIIEALTRQENLGRIVEGLSEEGRDALSTVLDQGGTMSWEDFDARYDNDLDESRYWNWSVPETTMGRLRMRGLLVEATVDGELRIVVPTDVRQDLREILS